MPGLMGHAAPAVKSVTAMLGMSSSLPTKVRGVLNSRHAPAVNVLATFGAVAFVDKLGRRKLLIIASVWMFVTQVSLAGR